VARAILSFPHSNTPHHLRQSVPQPPERRTAILSPKLLRISSTLHIPHPPMPLLMRLLVSLHMSLHMLLP